jgi:xylan 1,4-beta-xylosidase
MKNSDFALVVAVGLACSTRSLAAEPASVAAAAAADSFPVTIRVDAAVVKGELHPIWRFFGYDEPNYTYMKDGKKLLSELGQIGSPQVFVRTHHLLTSGDGSPALKWGSSGAYSEDPGGKPVYNWEILDRIFGTYLERGLRPYVQIGFMPEALSSHPQDYPHNPPREKRAPVSAGQAYPPNDYSKWGELCFQWARHCVEKYGRAEVEKWYWEVWNEPNIGYWKARPEDYFKLYDFAIEGVRRALPTARVGGPEVAGGGNKFLRDFLEHCVRGTNFANGKMGAPLDFIAFHAKGNPRFVEGHVRMGIANQLQDIERGAAIVASFPELKSKPIVIGESDPDGCAACPASEFPQNGYRTGPLYASYTAASFARKYDIADKYGVNLEGALTWAFEFEDQPFFAGFRVLASNGLDLPVLNTFRMMGKMSGQRVAAVSSADAGSESIRQKGVRESADVAALASTDGKKLCVLVWHYHDDDVAGPEAAVELELAGLGVRNGTASVQHYRIDEQHSNSFAAWKRMGSPPQPTAQQYAELEKAGQLTRLQSDETVRFSDGRATLRFKLPRQSVSLLVLGF